jgi:hypothetical protein
MPVKQLNNHEPVYCPKRFASLIRSVCWVALLMVVSTSRCFAESSNNFGEVTLKLGASGTCDSVPCMVYMVMPPGDGNYVVLANGMKAGEYPAGETVMVGKYWAGSTVFEIQGGDFGTAKLWVIGEDD